VAAVAAEEAEDRALEAEAVAEGAGNPTGR